jgi:hypothetical protein
MKTTHNSDSRILQILNQAQAGTPVNKFTNILHFSLTGKTLVGLDY